MENVVATHYISVSSVMDETPEGMYHRDRVTNFGYGRHGDISLYDDDELVVRRELTQNLEQQIISG